MTDKELINKISRDIRDGLAVTCQTRIPGHEAYKPVAKLALLSLGSTHAILSKGELAEIKRTLEWYEKKVRDCRKITSEGNAARHELDADGGLMASTVLSLLKEGLT